MIHLNTHLSKRNEDVNEIDNSFEHTLTKRNCKWTFEHTFIKEKWRCKRSRWFIWTHLSKRNEDVNEVDDVIWTHIYQREMKM